MHAVIKHLVCPQCGYDLHGIPEFRCPECGYGYDRAALRSLAGQADWDRLASAQAVTWRAGLAVALAVEPLAVRCGVGLFIRIALVVGVFLTICIAWAILTRGFDGWLSSTSAYLLVWRVALLLAVTMVGVPVLAALAALVLVAWGWLIRLWDWPALMPAGNAPLPQFHTSVGRQSTAATVGLCAATIMWFLAWVV